uniref:Uncharacterized protein n=1 Tax=viral metagenome TaxID=1070528 RepID=A0A6C0ELP7_9ZZZZ
MENEKQCRICLDTDRVEEMISPCLCNGSQRFIHRNCLNLWREQTQEAYHRCPTCHFRYRISRVWWGNLVTRPIVVGTVSLTGLVILGGVSGYCSASSYNTVYYWFHHMSYRTPHRLQTLFHALFWVGVPGLALFLRSLCNNNHGINVNPTVIDATANLLTNWPRRQPTVMINHYSSPPPPPPPSPEEKDEDRRRKRQRVARYESKSTFAWTVLIGGAISSVYHTYNWVYQRCLRLGTNAQELIENIN